MFDGEADLASGSRGLQGDSGGGPVKEYLRKKGRDFFGVGETQVGIDIDQILDEIALLKGDNINLQAKMDALSKGEDPSIPIVKKVLENTDLSKLNLDDIKGLTKNIGAPGGFTSCYNQDYAIAVDQNVFVEVGLRQGMPTGTEGQQQVGAPGQSSGVTGGQQTQSIGPLGLVKRPKIFRDKPQGMQMVGGGGVSQPGGGIQQGGDLQNGGTQGGGTGGGTTQQDGGLQQPGGAGFTATRNPFKVSMKNLLPDKPLHCQIGYIARRFDVLNQQIGGLETKIPSSATMDEIKTQLNDFTDIYDTIRLDFKYAKPSQWFEKVNSNLRATEDLLFDWGKFQQQYATDRQAISNAIGKLNALELDLESEIRKVISETKINIPSSTWDSQVGTRIANYNWDTQMSGRPKWDKALDDWALNHPIPGLGDKSIKQKFDSITADFAGDISDAIDGMNLGPDLKTMRNTITSIDTDMLNVKKKFNNLTDKLSSAKTGALSAKGIIGATSSASGSVRQILKDLSDLSFNFTGGSSGKPTIPIAVRVFCYVKDTRGADTAYWHWYMGKSLDNKASPDGVPEEEEMGGKTVKYDENGRQFSYDYGPFNSIYEMLFGEGSDGFYTQIKEVIDKMEKEADILNFVTPAMAIKIARSWVKAFRNFLRDLIRQKIQDIIDKQRDRLKDVIPDLNILDNVTLPGKFGDAELKSKLPDGWTNLFSSL